ncbi:MAG TPA: hypothetical protein VKA46_17485 [Gemmataceae bacterium]|nr:hypothetical protein [Gemmataceae bacterium]
MFTRWFSVPALAASLLLVGGAGLAQADGEKSKSKEVVSFGTLRATDRDTARAQAEAWLKEVGKTDAASQKAFADIWKGDRTVLDMVTDTLCLGDPRAKELLGEARDANRAAPTEVPSLVKDRKLPAFFRANLALAYAKALSNRRIYEEALEALDTVKAEQVVDPATFLFHKAVAEHSLMKAREASNTIMRLLDDVTDAPDRYKMVSALMVFDMMTWKDKDLGSIARKMDNIERRLDLSRGGPKTQKLQKEVIARLDELIKEKENQGQGQGQGNGGNCPNGGQPGSNPNNTTNPSSPQNDSYGGNGSGPGNVDPKKLKELAEVWGKLPEKDRAKAMAELTRDMPPRYREVIEKYFKKIAESGQ